MSGGANVNVNLVNICMISWGGGSGGMASRSSDIIFQAISYEITRVASFRKG